MTEVCCKECQFWAPPPEINQSHGKLPEGWGECRRRAPSGMSVQMTVANDGKVFMAIYPFAPMPPTDWCGEFLRANREVDWGLDVGKEIIP